MSQGTYASSIVMSHSDEPGYGPVTARIFSTTTVQSRPTSLLLLLLLLLPELPLLAVLDAGAGAM